MAMLNPQQYESNKSVSARDAAEFVPKLVKIMGTWVQNENILDYGCGAGSTGYRHLLPHVEQHNSNLYSVDISEQMVEFARTNYPHPRINYKRGDILDDFPFENIQFDKIFSVYVIHFIADIRAALKRFYSILKPGGHLGFTIVAKSFYVSSIRILGQSEKWGKYLKGAEFHYPEWMNYEEGKGYETCKELLATAGFQITHLEVQKRCFPFDNIETVLGLYMSLNPCIDSIPRELLFEFKNDVRKLITGFAGIPEDSEKITSRYECVIAVAEKPMSD